jgi:sugar lactone lactonase YvrE
LIPVHLLLEPQQVCACDLSDKSEVVASISGVPMGLGFLPDGRLLIVSMRDGLLLRREHDGSLVVHASLSHLSGYPWGDMVVDGRGNAYIGNLGFNFPDGSFAPGTLVLVTPDGSVRQVADGFAFPNGMVVTPDNKTLILAESYGHRLKETLRGQAHVPSNEQDKRAATPSKASLLFCCLLFSMLPGKGCGDLTPPGRGKGQAVRR